MKEIVIKIDERLFNNVVEIGVANMNITDRLALSTAIKNGTPLPKGHGRLIDADDLEHITVHSKTRDGKITQIEAPTIIEADKEVEG